MKVAKIHFLIKELPLECLFFISLIIMMGSFPILCKLILVSAIFNCTYVIATSKIYDVMKFGAIGNGIADDTKAMQVTWNQTCNSVGKSATMIIPEGKTFFMHATALVGPCKPAEIDIVLSGTIVGPNGPHEWKATDISKWLSFERVSGLHIYGGGLINGRGPKWWDGNCRYHPGQKGCITIAPTCLAFLDCKYVTLNNVSIRNSPQTHVAAVGGNNFVFGSLDVQSSGKSLNTDGIHLQSIHDVLIHSSNITSGDDCVSIGDGVSSISVTDINCSPGHGVSIGSLGRSGTIVNVTNINVTRVNFTGTTNGARIKTWVGGRGQVNDIVFSNLTFTDVENPIIIDQHYGDNKGANTGTGVHINNVLYKWATGTSNTTIAINLNCSSNQPCTKINMDQIQLTSVSPNTKLVSSCNYAHGTSGLVEPKSCLAP